ncbi:hypothetical protein PSQ90_03860 [Devosia rhodophyticola]|uniref:Secreted protein n=1 Tax=Devosia rhodophyticola TaxID=3026423 RepID=A0ABY7YYZ8_9HYPH|nr:hypothetical protein [Devosia rhodophyticola]WDR06608.1 hypothetical protein PSQ90_03860 [Devosia rhodophyticola]
MRNGLTGQIALSAGTRTGRVAFGLLVLVALAGCTTVEGTNALSDPGTFEREVITSTAQGVGLIPKGPPKEEPTTPRAPLALPRSTASLPTPTTSIANQLPVDSDSVQIDTSNLTEADLSRLRNARVVDLRSLSGRPLTEVESRALTARMMAANKSVKVNGKRPLYLPPDEYFTTVGGRDTVCKAANGELVALSDPKCPLDVRQALGRATPNSDGLIGSDVNNVLGRNDNGN